MDWNWQQENWAQFDYQASDLKEMEDSFIIESAKLIGAATIVTEDENHKFIIELMGEEALKSSSIEGEILNRNSVTSSILRQMGFSPQYSDHRADDREKGIAALMVNNYQTYEQPLTHKLMFDWHPCVVAGSLYIKDIGRYRTSEEPMQVVSGYEGRLKVHFEAPPATIVPTEMDAFITWFNNSAPNGVHPLPALARAGIAHLYFVTIHPFEDGNGRIGRALCDKALAQSLGRPALFSLSHHIEKTKKEYYKELEKSQKNISVSSWLSYFSNIIIDSVKHSQELIHFIVAKTRLYDRVRGQLNDRQEKVLHRLFSEGLDGFKGGLSVKNYISITGAERRTATRDLQKLVGLGVLMKTGKLKGTRYWLNIKQTVPQNM